MILYVDTTTHTGTWDWKLPVFDPDQPHMVRLAVALADETGVVVDRYCSMIRPMWGRRTIQPEHTKVHNIWPTDLTVNGQALSVAMARFGVLARRAQVMVAHNAQFHQHVLARSWNDIGLPAVIDLPAECTMRGSADIVRVRLMGSGQWKWPSLMEAYSHMKQEALMLPSDPIERGHAIVDAVMVVHNGIKAVIAGVPPSPPPPQEETPFKRY